MIGQSHGFRGSGGFRCENEPLPSFQAPRLFSTLTGKCHLASIVAISLKCIA